MRFCSNGNCRLFIGSGALPRSRASPSACSSSSHFLLRLFRLDTAARGSRRLGRFLGFHLLGVQRLLNPLVGSVGIGLVLLGRVVQIRLLADQKVHVGHRIIVVGIDVQGFLQVLHAIVDDGAILRLQIGLHFFVLQWTRLFGLQSQLVARLRPRSVPLYPVDDGQAIEAFLVLWIGRDQL